MRQRNLKPGQAQFENTKNGVRYMYLTHSGEVFKCDAANLDEAIAKRDEWLVRIEAFDELGMVRREL